MNHQKFDHRLIEAKWIPQWERMHLDEVDISRADKPYYNLMMFPYPSAEGLHVGNMYAFTGADIFGRFMRKLGYTVFEPIGLDGFGIHSENYAMKVGRHPIDHAKITEGNFYKQLHKIGSMYDWSRTLQTYDKEYYHWTQWLFIQMFKRGLAYRKTATVNWCPSCQTVLADEQVIDGKCERCGNLVENKSLEQWFFRITAYAEKLLENIPALKWSEKVKVTQTNWIGKKTGINIEYPVVDSTKMPVGSLTCFTTRPDTNYGATFVVIAPEHPFITQILPLLESDQRTKVLRYINTALTKSERDRTAEGRIKTGVETGLYCINHLNHRLMPVYVSDFVIMGFGTGAVVGVPAHDRRDFEFAQAFQLPVIRVVIKGDEGENLKIDSLDKVQEGEGVMIDSGFLNGKDTHEAIELMMDHMEKRGWGKRVATYHLRDWLISRQRYWGPPIPMIFCESCKKQERSWFTHGKENQQSKLSTAKIGKSRTEAQDNEGIPKDIISSMAGWYPVPDNQLPVELPYINDFKPTGDGIAPLAKHREFYKTTCPGCGTEAVRETDVSDTFLDSSWYFLRYPTLKSEQEHSMPFDPEITKRWLPVHMYTGGAEHSVLHLLYARFVTMILHDMKLLGFEEPFSEFFAHGLVIKEGAKMSKSKGNVVNPDEYIERYGSDALRLYLMFMGPFSQGGDFRDTAMEGMYRWVGRIWRMGQESIENNVTSLDSEAQKKQENELNKLILKAHDDTGKRRYNTAIASMMEFTNFIHDSGSKLNLELLKKFLIILSPYAPFLTEEMWQQIHGRQDKDILKTDSIHVQGWPEAGRVVDDEVKTIVVQINGKIRDTLTLSATNLTRDSVEDSARASEKVQKYLPVGQDVKVIYVPGKLINFVISS